MTDQELSIRGILASGKNRFRQEEISEVDAELLLAELLGLSRMQLHSEIPTLSEGELIDLNDKYRESLERRIAGTPTQYIIGEAPFRHLILEVGPGVLIPRPETEGLVSLALEWIEARAKKMNSGERISIVDLGSGSGAIAIALATELRDLNIAATVIAVEPSQDAHPILERNIARYEADVRLVKERAQDALIGVKCEIVVANPPYLANRLATSGELPKELHREPSMALYGGESGVELPKEFIDASARILKSGGGFFMEHEESQRASLLSHFQRDFIDVTTADDLAGKHRYIFATRR